MTTDSLLVADLALRLDAPKRVRRPLRLALFALLALSIDVGAVYLATREVGVPPPPPTEIPVEVIVEPPPPPPEPPPPSPSPSPAPKAEAPPPDPELQRATDAPREGKSDHDDPVAADKPKPAEATPQPAPASTPEETPTPAPAPSPVDTPAPAPSTPPMPEATDAELPAPPPTPPPPAPAPAPAKATAPPKPAAIPQMFASVPDIDFGGAAKMSTVTGGAARSTYTSQLYGLIYSRLHVPLAAHTYGRTLTGSIGFTIDGQGRLMQRYVAVASGSMELDEAVMQAIGAASSRFPRPPHGAPVGLTFTYSVN